MARTSRHSPQRKALFALFAAGTLTIVATGSVALNLSTSLVAAERSAPVEVVAKPATAAPAALILTPPADPLVVVVQPELPIAVGRCPVE